MLNIKSLGELSQFLKRGKVQPCNVSFNGFDRIPNINSKVNVIVSEFRDSQNVNINWEDEPFCLTNFREFNLYGYYSTRYCDMDYDESDNSLTITDSNGNEIILQY